MKRLSLLFLILLSSVAYSHSSRILLAYESTEFKNMLIDQMAALLEKDSSKVTETDHSKGALDSLDASAFNAVFITISGVNSKVRPWVLAWLEKNKKYRDRIILHTTQTRSWKVIAPVDAVTSASERRKVSVLAMEYVGLLKRRIAKPRKAGDNAAP